jgi:hypothetical protein
VLHVRVCTQIVFMIMTRRTKDHWDQTGFMGTNELLTRYLNPPLPATPCLFVRGFTFNLCALMFSVRFGRDVSSFRVVVLCACAGRGRVACRRATPLSRYASFALVAAASMLACPGLRAA